MRYLLWFTIGFGIACGLGVWVLPAKAVFISVLAAGVLSLLARKFAPKRLALMLLGCFAGLFWYLGFLYMDLLPAYSLDGVTARITVTATAHSYPTDYGVGVDGEFEWNGRTRKIRLYVNDVEKLEPGDVIEGEFQLRYTAPGGSKDPTYHAGDGTFLLGYPRDDIRVRPPLKKTLRHTLQGLNHTIARRLDAIFPVDTAPMSRALLLGDDFDLDYETDIALKLSGIRHIIAVSGLHVAMLYSVLRAITLNRRFLTALIGFPALYLFALAAGFTPSVSRACLMVGLMMIAHILNREYDAPSALAFAGLAMLLRNPMVISSISFQMSFACVAGIQLFDSRICEWLKAKLGNPKGKGIVPRLKRWFVSSVSISLSAIILTTPISAYYFGTVSLVGILTNLLTLWAGSLSFYGIVGALALSLVWWNGAAFLARLASLAMNYVTGMAELLSTLPLAALYTKSIYIVLWLIFVYILLAVFLLSTDRRPVVLGSCAAVGLCLALLLSWTEHTFFDVHLTALDVGHGQCLILHSEGRTFLIDCGGSHDEIAANAAADTLLSRGVSHLDGIILTQTDRDHAGGIPYLLGRIDTDMILVPATTERSTTQYLRGLSAGTVIEVDSDLRITLNSGIMTIIGPTFSPESNENSLCVLFEGKNCAILVTGDRSRTGELLLMREYPLPQVDLLLAGHHGSGGSTSAELLDRVRPNTVFISVGEDNAYGHPATETLNRLMTFGCGVFRTDMQGDLIFRR